MAWKLGVEEGKVQERKQFGAGERSRMVALHCKAFEEKRRKANFIYF